MQVSGKNPFMSTIAIELMMLLLINDQVYAINAVV